MNMALHIMKTITMTICASQKVAFGSNMLVRYEVALRSWLLVVASHYHKNFSSASGQHTPLEKRPTTRRDAVSSGHSTKAISPPDIF